MREELNRHKRRDRVKWIFTFIALFLAFIMLIALCMQLFCKGKFQPSNWFKKTEETIPSVPDGSEDNGGAVITDTENAYAFGI